jgi:hypothetical protein
MEFSIHVETSEEISVTLLGEVQFQPDIWMISGTTKKTLHFSPKNNKQNFSFQVLPLISGYLSPPVITVRDIEGNIITTSITEKLIHVTPSYSSSTIMKVDATE